MLKHILLVALGGAIGSVLRYGSTRLFSNELFSPFPYATLFVNLVGCFAIGVLYINLHTHPHYETIKAALMIGLLGGFTTFSSFALEQILLLKNGFTYTQLSYLLVSNMGGLLSAWLGTKWIWS